MAEIIFREETTREGARAFLALTESLQCFKALGIRSGETSFTKMIIPGADKLKCSKGRFWDSWPNMTPEEASCLDAREDAISKKNEGATYSPIYTDRYCTLPYTDGLRVVSLQTQDSLNGLLNEGLESQAVT